MIHILEIPAPDQPLTANQRLHFQRRAEATRNWRLRAAIRARGLEPLPFAHVTYWLSYGDAHNRKRDAANWYPTVKACLDGVVDAGVLLGDDDRYVIGPDPREGEVRDEFTVVIALDADCGCHDCKTRFHQGGAA